MIKNNILNFLLLLSLFCGLSSCNDSPFDETDDPETILCNSDWVLRYTDYEGGLCLREFYFNLNGTGEEREVYWEYIFGQAVPKEYRYSFRWEWDEEYPYSIFIDYANGDYSYFGDLEITNRYLKGTLNDDDIIFTAE